MYTKVIIGNTIKILNEEQLKKLLRKKDKCVYCGCETEYDVNEHIDYRMYYVEGAGQLCKECWEKIYGK